MAAGKDPGVRPPTGADEPVSRPRRFLDTAEPLTVWRVDLAVLVGVAHDAPTRATAARDLLTGGEPG
jgi:hypothetical protein